MLVRATFSPYSSAVSVDSPVSVTMVSTSSIEATLASARCPNFELSAMTMVLVAAEMIARLSGTSRVLVLVMPAVGQRCSRDSHPGSRIHRR
jgi:hypothetical protein